MEPKYFYKSREQKRYYTLLNHFHEVSIIDSDFHKNLSTQLNADHKEDRIIAELYLDEVLLDYGRLKYEANKIKQ